MLVLTRKASQRVILTVGDTRIVVHVLEVTGTLTRLGFTAPRDVRIVREEIESRRPKQ